MITIMIMINISINIMIMIMININITVAIIQRCTNVSSKINVSSIGRSPQISIPRTAGTHLYMQALSCKVVVDVLCVLNIDVCVHVPAPRQ